jgi:glycosyltransferase involved in cell wall biosynthesis
MFETTTQPLVSIIMPTYNRADYIIESVNSIQNQTYQNWELIIVDDGSTDNTEELITGLEESRIKFYKSSKIGIVGKLKNIGINNSSGQFIAFNDSDDLWAPSKLERQINALRTHPEAGFCMTGGYNFKRPYEPVEYFYKERQGQKFGNFFIGAFQSEMSGFTQTLLFKKTCLAKAGYFPEEKSFADPEFILKLALNFNAVILYESLVFRRLHNDNHNSSAWVENYYTGINNIRTYKKQLPKTVSANAFFRLYINFGEDCLLHGKTLAAINKFLTSWKYKPFSIVPIKKAGKAILNYFA